MAVNHEGLVIPDDAATAATVAMYDRIPETFAGHFAGFRSCVPDIERAHELAGVALGESRVVEIGCGDGRDAETAFVPAAAEYTGYDPSEGLLRLAREKFPEGRPDMFRVGYAETTDYDPDQDIMIAVNSILHVRGQNLYAMYERIAEGLRRNGVFYGITKVADVDEVEVYHDNFDGVIGERTFYHHSPTTLQEQAAKAGLVLAFEERTDVPSKPWDWYSFGLAKSA